MSSGICILSGTTRLRLPSPVNHRLYADLHQADYRFECGPASAFRRPLRVFKLEAILRVLPRYEWVLWIDDDAFFTDFSIDPRSFIAGASPDLFLMLADGRVRPGGAFTMANSGVMLIRNTPECLAFLRRCLEIDDGLVKNRWDPERYGMFTNNSDQDAIIYLLSEELDPKHFAILPNARLNSRPYHYDEKLSEHFVVHFPGVPDKVNAVRRFGERFGVGLTLIPPLLIQQNGLEPRAGEDFILLPRRKFWVRVVRRMRRGVGPIVSRFMRAAMFVTALGTRGLPTHHLIAGFHFGSAAMATHAHPAGPGYRIRSTSQSQRRASFR